jgi:RNA polymerase sigma-B factor
MRPGRCDAGRLGAERALFERYVERRDPVDREMLVERFMPLARALARRNQTAGEPVERSLSGRMSGGRQGDRCFDLSRGVAFSTYAVPTMLGEIRRYLRDRRWSVHVPRGL